MKRYIAKELYFETLFYFNRQTLSAGLLCIVDENKPLIFTAVPPFIALPLHLSIQNVFVKFLSLNPFFNLPQLFLSTELQIVTL